MNGYGGVAGVGGIGGVGPRGVSPGRPLLTAAEEAALVAPPAPLVRATKATPMHIRFKFGQLGGGKGQFNSPHGFCLGNDEDIIVADTNNHRITVCFQVLTLLIEKGQLLVSPLLIKIACETSIKSALLM